MATLKLIAKAISMLSLYTSLIFAEDSLFCNYHDNRILCPDDVLEFVCSVSDGVATVWRGSIFNCPNR